MAFTQEVQEWINELELSPEELQQIAPVLEKRQDKLKGSVLRQADYSRKTQALAKEKADLETEIAARADQYQKDLNELATWKTTADTEMLKNHEQMVSAQTKLYEITQRAKAIPGIDLKALGFDENDVVTPPPTKKDDADFTEYDKRFLTRDEASKLRNEVTVAPDVSALIHDLDVEHRELFGKPLNARNLLEETRKWNKANPNNQRGIESQWQAMNDVTKRRADLQEQGIEARIKTRVDEETMKLRSEHKLPITRGNDGAPPTILSMRGDLGLKERPREDVSAVDAAVSAYNSGRYRTSALPKV